MAPPRLLVNIVMAAVTIGVSVTQSDSMSFGVPRRQARLFSGFDILQFEHTPCKYDSRRNGTCMQGAECTAAGGDFNTTNTCNFIQGQTFGVCCLVSRSCGGVIQTNNSYFVNPEFPDFTVNSQSCDVTVIPKRGTCYVRLQFDNFTIHDPVEGSCVADQFFVPQAEIEAPMLCGRNNDTHMYLYVKDFGEKQNITLRFNLGEWNGDRKWQINVAFIECNKDWTPGDRSCMQYFMERTDTIRSFNYHQHDPEKSAMLAGLDYTVCVRQALRRCYISWTSEFFSLSAGNKTTEVGGTCNQNYVIINQGFDSKKRVSFDRYCGQVLGANNNSSKASAVLSSARPYHLRVRTSTNSTSLGKGFLMRYSQLQCLNKWVITHHD
ncbi:uncharacterized protein LOC108864479 [Galendromus occidentalis]|uniref:Uncharacterized protein LOC108864479 n=1 Tax=Galendromus occidentalis TaxID=34638 RepID=A0AAJ7L6Q9_9ACAR|nr:uncharacterized protein LOC108864479 [Galendromus occidentalis]